MLNDPYSRTSAIMTNPKAKQSNKRLTDRKPPHHRLEEASLRLLLLARRLLLPHDTAS
jgi:hypothetical protein